MEISTSFIKNEFIRVENGTLYNKIKISDRFNELKGVLMGDALAPFIWLENFAGKKINEIDRSPVIKAILKKKCIDVPVSEADIFTEEFPFAKRKKFFINEQYVVEQNYYYSSNLYMHGWNNTEDDNKMNDIEFYRGYSHVCTKCASLGIIWDILFSLQNDKGSMQEMLEGVLPRGLSNTSELQTKLALAIIHIHTAKIEEDSHDKQHYLEKRVEKLVLLLKENFDLIYKELEKKITHKSVWMWENKVEMIAMVQLGLNFMVTGTWILPKLLNYLNDQRVTFISPLTITEFILFVNSNRPPLDAETQWLTSMNLILRNLSNSPSTLSVEFQTLILNLPYLLLFITSSFAVRIRQVLGRDGFRMLAGLVTTSHCFHLYHHSFNATITGPQTTAGEQPSTHLSDYIFKGLWIEHNSTFDMDSLAMNRVGAVSQALCTRQGSHSIIQSHRGACEVISRFGFPYLSTHITELKTEMIPLDFSYILCIQKRSWEEALNELRDYTKLEHRSLRDSESLSRSKGKIEESLRPIQNIAKDFISSTFTYIDSILSDTASPLQSTDINEDDTIRLFIGIKDIWQYLHLDIFTEAVDGRCIVINFKNTTDACRAMEPVLIATAQIAMQNAGITKYIECFKNPEIIKKIDLFNERSGTICCYFSVPESTTWIRNMDTLGILNDFEGFEQLPSLSSYEMDLLLKGYQKLSYLEHGETFFSKIVHAFLEIKGEAFDVSDISRITSEILFHDDKQVSVVYSLAILNLMLENTRIRKQTEKILTTLDRTVENMNQRPSYFFAKAFASNSNASPILVKTALGYIAKNSPLNVVRARNSLQRRFSEWHKRPLKISFHSFIQDPSNFTRDMGGTKENALAACCMHSLYPDMRILSHWVQSGGSKGIHMKDYYDINPDILTVAMLREISLMTALGVSEQKQDQKKVKERIDKTMQLARYTLLVTREVMENSLLFIADYFKVYKHEGERVAGVNPTILFNYVDQQASADDELVRRAVEGMRIKIKESILKGTIQDLSTLAEKNLLDAMKIAGGMFEYTFKTFPSPSTGINDHLSPIRLLLKWKKLAYEKMHEMRVNPLVL